MILSVCLGAGCSTPSVIPGDDAGFDALSIDVIWLDTRSIDAAVSDAGPAGEDGGTPGDDAGMDGFDGGMDVGMDAGPDVVDVPCPPGAFDHDDDSSSTCVSWTACGAGEYVAMAGDESHDQVCAGCESGHYSEDVNAEACQPWSTCPAGTFVEIAGDASRDQVCASCPPGTFTSGENQAACVEVEACEPGTRRVPSGCEACVVGEHCPGGEAGSSACSGGMWDHDADPATACVERTECIAGMRVVDAGDATNDRACEECEAGTYSTTTNVPRCAEWRECAAGEWASAASTTQNRVCIPCAAGTFSTEPNSPSCQLWTTCNPGEHMSTTGTMTRDRGCSECEVGSYTDVANAEDCHTWSDCPPGTFVDLPPDTTADRICEACEHGTFNTVENASVCEDWTECGPGGTASGGSATSDQVCM